jgi:lipoprotein-anchoring transpeptidase ErfK/SrfK
MAMRALAFVMLAAVALGGCIQDVATGTLDPSTDASWKQRDKDLMSNLPYNQSAVSETYRRHIVDYHRKEAPGTIVVDSDNRFLYYVMAKGKAIRYGIAVGEEAQAWSGVAKVGRMEEWPAWHPTPSEQARLGPLPEYVTGGPHNPMGSRGMYLFSNNRDTLYRIHGTNQPEYIGGAVSSGCIRMTNEDAIDLYNRVKVGTLVIVLAPHQNELKLIALDGLRRKWRRSGRHFHFAGSRFRCQSAIASDRIDWRSNFLVAHDLFGKPVSTPDQVRSRLFPDHAVSVT